MEPINEVPEIVQDVTTETPMVETPAEVIENQESAEIPAEAVS